MNNNWSYPSYDTWHSCKPIVDTDKRYDPMTTCIAGLADGGKTLILVADKLSLSRRLVRISENRTKIQSLDEKHFVMLGGNETFAFDVYRRVLESTKTYSSTREWAEAIAKAYCEKRFDEVEARILGSLRYTRDTFIEAQNKMSSVVMEKIMFDLQHYTAETDNTEIMVIGIDADKFGHIFTVKAPGYVLGETTSDFHALGTVPDMIYEFLQSQGYNKDLDENTATYLLFEAKKLSEASLAIGKRTDVYIIDNEGSDKIDADTIRELGRAHRDLHKPMKNERKARFTKVGKVRKNSPPPVTM